MKRQAQTFVAVLAMVALLARPVAAGVVVVTPNNMDGWAEDSTPPADVMLVNGPGSPPLGSGSAKFTVDATGATDAELRNDLSDGVSLGSITAIDYWTWVTTNGGGANNSCQAVYIILNVDRDNDGLGIFGNFDDLLFFEPCYQNGTYPTLSYSGAIPNQCGTNPNCVAFNTWQHWDAKIGGWWSFLDSAGGPPLTTLAAYAAQYPSAVIRNAVGPTKGGVRLTAGFGGPTDWGNFDGNTDAFTIGVSGNNTTYDFELIPRDVDDDDFDEDGDQDDVDEDDDNDGVNDDVDDDDDNDGDNDAVDADDDNDGIEDAFDSEHTYEEQSSYVVELGRGGEAQYLLAAGPDTLSITAVLADGQAMVMDILNPVGAVIADTVPTVGRSILVVPTAVTGKYTMRIRNLGTSDVTSKLTLIRSNRRQPGVRR